METIVVTIKEDNIPNACGHIPTLNELVDYNALERIMVMDNHDDTDGRIRTLTELSIDFIHDFNISRDIDIDFGGEQTGGQIKYQAQSNTAKILADDGKVTYAFDIDQ